VPAPVLDSPGISRLMPPRFFMICLVGGMAAEWLLPSPLSPLAVVPWPSRLLAGAALAVGGFLFMMWGHNRFTAVGTAVKTCLPASELVTAAAYRFSRNPMYVGFVAILLGFSAAANSLAMMLSALAMYLYLDRYVIPREERYLRRYFGAAYDAYCRNVRRWL
jgi:protein-S-isoprenylcysteine O-methyltransferase Ste14